MYRLGLLSDDPTKDIGKLIALTTCAGFFGVFFVIPLRKYYIVHQKLTFPTPALYNASFHCKIKYFGSYSSTRLTSLLTAYCDEICYR